MEPMKRAAESNAYSSERLGGHGWQQWAPSMLTNDVNAAFRCAEKLLFPSYGVDRWRPVEQCERTACLYMPGVPLPGVHCTYTYMGKVPGTGRYCCFTCGKDASGWDR